MLAFLRAEKSLLPAAACEQHQQQSVMTLAE